MNTSIIIIGRILASPLVNVFQKKLTTKNVSPELILMMSYIFFSLLAIPYILIFRPFYFPLEFWIYILLLGVFDVFGNMYLIKSLKAIDLSVFGPLNAFKPVFALLFSVILLHEMPSVVGASGVLIIILGSYFLTNQSDPLNKGLKKIKVSKGVGYRFLAILLTAVAAVFSKKTIKISSPLITLVYWSLIGLPFSIILFLRSAKSYQKEWDSLFSFRWTFLALFISFLGLQILTLLTFERVFVGYSLALFQLSGIVSVAFGFHFFKESNIKYRLIGALIMFVGAVLIAVFG